MAARSKAFSGLVFITCRDGAYFNAQLLHLHTDVNAGRFARQCRRRRGRGANREKFREVLA